MQTRLHKPREDEDDDENEYETRGELCTTPIRQHADTPIRLTALPKPSLVGTLSAFLSRQTLTLDGPMN